MKTIALTGGIGSGKSTVADMLRIMGLPVFDADSAAKELYQNNQEIRKGIISIVGTQVFDAENKLDKKLLASIIFKDPDLLKKINALVHPAVIAQFGKWLQKKSDQPLVVHETALLFESGLDKLSDRIVLISAPKELRIERVCRHRGWSRDRVLERIHLQSPEDEIMAKADYIIQNDERNALLPQVIELLRKLSSLN